MSSSARFLTNSLSDNSPLSNDASPGDFCSTGFSETEGGGGEECLPRFLLFLLLEFLAASESLALESTGDRLRLDFLDFLDFLLLYSTSLKSLKDSPESEYLDLPFLFRKFFLLFFDQALHCTLWFLGHQHVLEFRCSVVFNSDYKKTQRLDEIE